jgi:UDP-N-acetylmuramate--alanine ligase
MVATLLDAGGLDPTVVNGGIIHRYNSNARIGQGEWMVVEADESDGTFNRLPATVAIVTNIDPEHMEHWGTIEAPAPKGFLDFVSNIPVLSGGRVLHGPPGGAGSGGQGDRPRVRSPSASNAQADVRANAADLRGRGSHISS